MLFFCTGFSLPAAVLNPQLRGFVNSATNTESGIGAARRETTSRRTWATGCTVLLPLRDAPPVGVVWTASAAPPAFCPPFMYFEASW